MIKIIVFIMVIAMLLIAMVAFALFLSETNLSHKDRFSEGRADAYIVTSMVFVIFAAISLVLAISMPW